MVILLGDRERSMKLSKIASITSTIALASMASLTAEAADCTGYDVLVTQTAESTDLAEGHSILILKAHSVLVTNDPNNIYNLTMGSCFGTFENFPDGTSQGSGHCARKDKDGDTYSLSWAQVRGAKRG